MSIHFICWTCHEEASNFCGGCYRVSYCSVKCQTLNWKEHKIFCNKGEDQNIAEKRRKLCLKMIENSGNCLFSYFMRMQLAPLKPGFLFIQGDWLESELLHQKPTQFDEETFSHVYLEDIGMYAKKLPVKDACSVLEIGITSKKLRGTRHVPVLYLGQNHASVWLLSSKGKEFKAATSLERPLIKTIFSIYLDLQMNPFLQCEGMSEVQHIVKEKFSLGFDLDESSSGTEEFGSDDYEKK